MKVLNVNITLDPVRGGGTTERTFQMSRFLAKAGVRCTILTTASDLTAERLDALADVELIALPCLWRRFYIPRFSLRRVRQVVAGADLVHLMGHWNFLNVLVYFFASRLNKPYVICPAGELPIFGRSRLIKKVFNWAVGKKIMHNAAGCIAVTAAEIPQFAAYGIDPGKITVIPNGINTADFLADDAVLFRKQHGLADVPFILFVGRLNTIKGPDLLLRAFCSVQQHLRDYHLVFVGPDGGMLAELESIAAACGATDRVHFLGYLGAADKSRAYNAADFLVIPSRQEAMSIVVLEAAASATPVLITDQCGFDEVGAISGGRVTPATVEGIVAGLEELLADPSQLPRMGEALRQYAVEHFSWERIAVNYVQIYTAILGGKAAGDRS